MKTEAALSPSDDGIEGHVPRNPDDDHGYEDRTGDGNVSPEGGRLEALQNRTDLQADEHEGEHVQHEDDRLPHGVGRYAHPRGGSFGRGPRHGNGVAHHGEHTRKTDPIGEYPDAKRADELKNDGRGHVVYTVGQSQEEPRERRTRHDAAGHREQEGWRNRS